MFKFLAAGDPSDLTDPEVLSQGMWWTAAVSEDAIARTRAFVDRSNMDLWTESFCQAFDGKTMVFVGPTGAGKTRLCKAFLGIDDVVEHASTVAMDEHLIEHIDWEKRLWFLNREVRSSVRIIDTPGAVRHAARNKDKDGATPPPVTTPTVAWVAEQTLKAEPDVLIIVLANGYLYSAGDSSRTRRSYDCPDDHEAKKFEYAEPDEALSAKIEYCRKEEAKWLLDFSHALTMPKGDLDYRCPVLVLANKADCWLEGECTDPAYYEDYLERKDAEDENSLGDIRGALTRIVQEMHPIPFNTKNHIPAIMPIAATYDSFQGEPCVRGMSRLTSRRSVDAFVAFVASILEQANAQPRS